METYKGFKVRIYPTEEQEQLLKHYCYCSRKIWNYLVEKFNNKKDVKFTKFGIKDYKSRDLLNDIEKEYGLIDIPERIALDNLSKYSQTWKMFFKYPKQFGRPKFHKYNPNKQSFKIISRNYELVDMCIQIPYVKTMKGKITNKFIPINLNFLNKFLIKEVIEPQYTCIRGKWYLSGTYKENISDKKQSEDWLGLDWGIKNFYTDNNGNFYNYPNSVNREYQRIKKLQSYKDKKKKGSNNRLKLGNKLFKAFERFENLKKDYIEQTTSKLSNSNIVVENLTNAKIKQSTKNRRRLQLLAPRTKFNERLQQKCILKNNKYIEVDPSYTSRTCNKCGVIKSELGTNVRVFICECGYIEDRDINASMNILARGFC